MKGDNLEDMHDSALNFPNKLFCLLETQKYTHLITWKEHGCCFHITDIDVFSTVVIPILFKQSKWESFRRQLNVYGFKKIIKGPDKDCYFHPYFRRDKKDLLRKIRRLNINKGKLPKYEDVVLPEIIQDVHNLPHGNSHYHRHNYHTNKHHQHQHTNNNNLHLTSSSSPINHDSLGEEGHHFRSRSSSEDSNFSSGHHPHFTRHSNGTPKAFRKTIHSSPQDPHPFFMLPPLNPAGVAMRGQPGSMYSDVLQQSPNNRGPGGDGLPPLHIVIRNNNPRFPQLQPNSMFQQQQQQSSNNNTNNNNSDIPCFVSYPPTSNGSGDNNSHHSNSNNNNGNANNSNNNYNKYMQTKEELSAATIQRGTSANNVNNCNVFQEEFSFNPFSNCFEMENFDDFMYQPAMNYSNNNNNNPCNTNNNSLNNMNNNNNNISFSNSTSTDDDDMQLIHYLLSDLTDNEEEFGEEELV